ncbi:MAG: BMP family ABC transporter substrate-binding protein [Sebaldella sp.]|nr:BMP family ABC transporter substrate-binding protein [Sebaldella sp.]
MKKILLVLTLSILFLVSCGKKDTAKDAPKEETKTEGKAEANSNMKVAIVYSTGGLGDDSFNDAARRGLDKAKAELGITFDEYEPKDPNTEAENQLRTFAESGEYSLIIATGFSMKDALLNVAKEFPDQKFAIIDERIEGYKNIASLSFKEHEGSFLVGALAAMMTKSNTVAFVGGAEAPLIQKFEAGFKQGALYVNPEIKVLSVYVGGTNAFNDPTSAKARTEALISQGADVIYHAAGASGKGVFQAAKEKGVYAIGVDSNQDGIVQGVILTSMIKKVDTAVFDLTKQVQENKFEGKIYEYGLKEDGVGTTDFKYTKDKIGEENIKKLEDIKKKIEDGEIQVKSTR